MNASTCQTGVLKTDDHLDLFYQYLLSGAERGRLVIAHGLGEHSGRYQELMKELAELGLSCWAPDHRGHGRSGGRRGHVDTFDQYLTDLDQLMAVANQDRPAGQRLFLFGHSMGGLIAVRYVQKHPRAVDGLALSSPALGMVIKVSGLKLKMAEIMSKLWPALSLNNGVDSAYISHDAATVTAYRNDPLVHPKITARWTMEFLHAIQTANDQAAEVKVPCSMQIAGDDHLVSAPSSRTFFEHLAVSDKTLHYYEDYYHENFNETPDRREIALADLKAWLGARL